MSIWKALGGILDVDVPVVHPAVDVDVADAGPRRGRRAVLGDLEQSEDGPGAVPVLAHGRLGTLDAPGGQFPVGVQPVGIADHDDEPVGRGGLVFGGGLVGEVFGLGQLGLDLFEPNLVSWRRLLGSETAVDRAELTVGLARGPVGALPAIAPPDCGSPLLWPTSTVL